jgi:hypothetical protein
MKLIPLTKGKFAQVDDADFEWLNQWKWSANGTADKAVRRGTKVDDVPGKLILMHRVVLGLPSTQHPHVDHKDCNGLNNQRCNLRICNQSQNQANQRLSKNNTSGYKGVVWHSGANKWMARIVVHRKGIYLGIFIDKLEAVKAYRRAAVEYFGEFARF